MEERQEPKRFDLCTSNIAVFIAIAVGLLLIVVGASIENGGVASAGAYILPLALIWGGLFLQTQSTAVKATLVAIGGIMILITSIVAAVPF